MSYVIAAPEIIASASSDLAGIESALSAANAAAATQTTAVLAAAEDEVSAAIAELFSQHAQEYQALVGQVAAFQDQFTGNLLASANSYLSTEAASANAVAASIGGSGDIVQSIETALVSELVSNIPGVEDTELFIDAIGPVIVTGPALAHSQTAFVNAVQAGNLEAATAALVNAPASVAGPFLYGQDTVTVPLSLPGVSVRLDVPVGGVLAPLQPISATVAIAGNPPMTFPIPGTQTGGIVPALIGSISGGGGLLG